MRHPSVKDKLYRFLQQNPGWHAKGQLERMEWRKKDGTLATPDNVGRRLRELAEDGKIKVEQRKGHDWYAIPETAARPKMVGINIIEEGESRWVQVPEYQADDFRAKARARGMLA